MTPVVQDFYPVHQTPDQNVQKTFFLETAWCFCYQVLQFSLYKLLTRVTKDCTQYFKLNKWEDKNVTLQIKPTGTQWHFIITPSQQGCSIS